MRNRHILVLGVGNILMSDEGAGVCIVQRLEKEFTFSDNVELLDGGTLGMRLLHPISQASCLIVADTALLGNSPGSISRLTFEDVKLRTVLKNSMHQLSFAETLTMAEVMDILPTTTIITIEPEDIETMSINLTPVIAERIDAMCNAVLDEVTASGGSFKKRSSLNN